VVKETRVEVSFDRRCFPVCLAVKSARGIGQQLFAYFKALIKFVFVAWASAEGKGNLPSPENWD